MRDFGRRIQRYRASLGAHRHGRGRGRGRGPRLRRWIWVLFALWVVWAFAFSDHSLLRIASLRAENQRSVSELAGVREAIDRLEREAADPRQERLRAERWLREQGGMARRDEIIYRIQDGAPDTIPR